MSAPVVTQTPRAGKTQSFDLGFLGGNRRTTSGIRFEFGRAVRLVCRTYENWTARKCW